MTALAPRPVLLAFLAPGAVVFSVFFLLPLCLILAEAWSDGGVAFAAVLLRDLFHPLAVQLRPLDRLNRGVEPLLVAALGGLHRRGRGVQRRRDQREGRGQRDAPSSGHGSRRCG